MKHFCEECGTELEYMWVTNADKSLSGKTEKLYLCRGCLSTWEVVENEDGSFSIRRYFFG